MPRPPSLKDDRAHNPLAIWALIYDLDNPIDDLLRALVPSGNRLLTRLHDQPSIPFRFLKIGKK
jgi:hypothetical protein